LAHLYANYARINPADLDKNDLNMKLPCDVNQPIEVLFQQIEDAIEFASAGQAPYSPQQVLNIAYQLIFRTGLFADDCKVWKRQPADYKTWPQFKLDFSLAYQEYNETLDLSPAAAGFHAATKPDQHDDTILAIANLATATAADRTAVANLTSTNATLTKELTTSNTKLITALNMVNTLQKQINERTPTGQSRTSTSGARKHYCWTCGYRSEHSSFYCPTPATGHQTRAKASDTMNGSTANKSFSNA
jgi:hypothetical protein